MKENQTTKHSGVKQCGVVTYARPYEEAHVSADLSQMAMLMIAMLCDQVEQNKSYGELIQTKNALSKFGFSSSQSAKLLGEMSEQMQRYTEATNTLAFMEEVWEKFGKDAMVVRYDHFFEILEKYDMVCGAFDRYTGAIPQEAIDTLNRLSDMWERKEFRKRYGMKLEYAQILELTEENGIEPLIKRLRMPLRVCNASVMKQIESLTIPGLDINEYESLKRVTDALFIAAPAADMLPLEMEMCFRTPKYEELRNAEYPEPEPVWVRDHIDDYLAWNDRRIVFMNNVRAEMRKEEERLKGVVRNSDLNRYAKIDFIKEEPQMSRMLLDPFICSLTPHGVLIHAKWGVEAEDATIKRYEQLRDAIIGKGGIA